MIQILTPTGYKDISTVAVGDQVKGYTPASALPVTNTILSIQWVDATEWARWWSVAPSVPAFNFYLINGTYTFNGEQSIWRGSTLVHARDLVVGDTIWNDTNHPFAITTIATVSAPGWWRLEISGNHAYIIDGVEVHNASRFWVTGTGTWDSSTTTHWAASTGGAGSQSVPGSADTVTFDGSSGGGTVTVNFGGTITVQSITCGAFTGTLDFSANNNSVTLSASGGFSGSGSGTRTINLGNGTWSLTNASAGSSIWTMTTTTGLTFSANSSIIDFTGIVAAGSAQSFQGGGLPYSTLRISGARHDSGLFIGGANTVAVLTNTAAAYVSLSVANTITTLTQSAQLTLVCPTTVTTTITNAPTLTGTLSAPLAILNSSASATATAATISCASGTFSGTFVAIEGIAFTGGATFTFTNSFDLGRNSGATITPPSAGGGLPPAPIVVARGTPY